MHLDDIGRDPFSTTASTDNLVYQNVIEMDKPAKTDGQIYQNIKQGTASKPANQVYQNVADMRNGKGKLLYSI